MSTDHINTNEAANFLRVIACAPEDVAPRLIFADWLEEHRADRCAHFIRAHIEFCRHLRQLTWPKAAQYNTLTPHRTNDNFHVLFQMPYDWEKGGATPEAELAWQNLHATQEGSYDLLILYARLVGKDANGEDNPLALWIEALLLSYQCQQSRMLFQDLFWNGFPSILDIPLLLISPKADIGTESGINARSNILTAAEYLLPYLPVTLVTYESRDFAESLVEGLIRTLSKRHVQACLRTSEERHEQWQLSFKMIVNDERYNVKCKRPVYTAESYIVLPIDNINKFHPPAFSNPPTQVQYVNENIISYINHTIELAKSGIRGACSPFTGLEAKYSNCADVKYLQPSEMAFGILGDRKANNAPIPMRQYGSIGNPLARSYATFKTHDFRFFTYGDLLRYGADAPLWSVMIGTNNGTFFYTDPVKYRHNQPGNHDQRRYEFTGAFTL
jgi:uncharacterized protein (TIGR02996 family)